jgi:pimeloyl-ACP methyl ester carboxylesterase
MIRMTDEPQRHTVEVAGLPVGYYVQGQGPELVLLHGATGHPETSFAGLIEHFTKTRTVIVPGYSGSTLTPLPDGELDVDLLADQMLGVIRVAAHGPADIFGISTGSVVAAAAAAKEPGLVRRMALLGGFAHYRHPWQRLLARTWMRLIETDANGFAEFTMLHVVSDGFLDSLSAPDRLRLRAGMMPSKGMAALIELVGRLDISDCLQKIESPTLVIAMTKDQLVPVRYAKDFCAAIPGCEYVEIDSGHAAATEKPDVLLRVIQDFLD